MPCAKAAVFVVRENRHTAIAKYGVCEQCLGLFVISHLIQIVPRRASVVVETVRGEHPAWLGAKCVGGAP